MRNHLIIEGPIIHLPPKRRTNAPSEKDRPMTHTPAFTDQHYAKIAMVLKDHLDKFTAPVSPERTALMELTNDLARGFALDNPEFDRTRFFEAVHHQPC